MTSKLPLRSTLLIFCSAVFAVSAHMLIIYYLQGSGEENVSRKLTDAIAAQETPLPDSVDALPAATGALEFGTAVCPYTKSCTGRIRIWWDGSK